MQLTEERTFLAFSIVTAAAPLTSRSSQAEKKQNKDFITIFIVIVTLPVVVRNACFGNYERERTELRQLYKSTLTMGQVSNQDRE
jgi:hypothetical protein